MPKHETNVILHVLRNPYGISKEFQREVAVEAANRIEVLDEIVKKIKRILPNIIKAEPVDKEVLCHYCFARLGEFHSVDCVYVKSKNLMDTISKSIVG